jgi:hypothetical protein
MIEGIGFLSPACFSGGPAVRLVPKLRSAPVPGVNAWLRNRVKTTLTLVGAGAQTNSKTFSCLHYRERRGAFASAG